MYYIYHIKGIKIGCSTQVNKRVKEQGYSDFEILEEHTNIYEVSDREIKLQKQYGYKVDTIPYWKSSEQLRKNATFKSASKGGKKGGDTSKQLGHIQKAQKIGCVLGGKTTGKMLVQSGRLYQMSLKSADLSSIPIIATNIKTGEEITFKSMCDTARSIGSTSANVVKLLKYKQGKTIKGYTLRYA